MIMKKILFLITAIIMVSCSKETEYDAMGRFEANDVVVSAESAGKLIYVNVAEGDKLNNGDIIAITDTTLLSLERKQIEAQIEVQLSSQPDIQREAAALRSEISKQKKEKERFQKLVADGAAPQKQLDDINASLNVLEDKLDALLSRLGINKASINNSVSALRVRIEQVEEQISRCYIKAPINGIVLNKFAENGEFVQPGKPLFKIANMDKIFLRSYFTSDQLAKVKLGDKVRVIANYGGDERHEYEGTITNISSESEFTPKTIQTKDSRANLVYAVKIAVKNDGRLKIGFTGEVYLK